MHGHMNVKCTMSVYHKLMYRVLTFSRDISHEVKFKYLFQIISQYLLVAYTYAWPIPVTLRSKT